MLDAIDKNRLHSACIRPQVPFVGRSTAAASANPLHRLGLLAMLAILAVACREPPAAKSAAPTKPGAEAAAGAPPTVAAPAPTPVQVNDPVDPDPLGFPSLRARVSRRAHMLATGQIDDATRRSIARGEAFFLAAQSTETGLGPYYSESACVNCHNIGGPLGRGEFARAATVYSSSEAEAFGDLHPKAGGGNVPKYTLPGYPAFHIPSDMSIVGMRQPPLLQGLGWLEAVPAAQIYAQKHCEPRKQPDGVCGFAPPRPESGAGTLRFSIKSTSATIDEFVSGALFLEMGLTAGAKQMNQDIDHVADPEVALQTVVDLANYIAFSPPPGQPLPASDAQGLATYRTIGCADCHWSAFTLEGKPTPQFYSDLLAHDMGPALADTHNIEITPASYIRTTPLWGLRKHPGPYLHNGSAATLEAAVLAHDGEAAPARKRFADLSQPEREAVLQMLRDL